MQSLVPLDLQTGMRFQAGPWSMPEFRSNTETPLQGFQSNSKSENPAFMYYVLRQYRIHPIA